ncbi:MAG TPA: peptidoglycan-binding protein [Candidatus Paceibacterota bacterium]
MFKKIGFALVGLSLFATPLIASATTLSDVQAQIASLLAQIKELQKQTVSTSSDPVMCTMEMKECPDGTSVGRTGPNCEFASCGGVALPSRVCPQILRTLSQGSRGDDVLNLQTYLGVTATGYFGPLTASAVFRFQADEGLSQVGIVGPLTRAAFARRCGIAQNGSFSASPTRGVVPLPVNFTYAPKTDDAGQYYIEFGDGEGQLMDVQQIYCIRAPCISPSVASHTYDSVGVYTASVSRYTACLYSNPRCLMAQPAPLATVVITVGNGGSVGTPSISGVDGPTTLALGASGTWSVHVTDSSGYLSYSVKWGDETAVPLAYGTAASAQISSSGTFTHTYAISGTYMPKFTVTNRSGESASASATVVVRGNSCPVVRYTTDCMRGYHGQAVYDASGCTIDQTCVPDLY